MTPFPWRRIAFAVGGAVLAAFLLAQLKQAERTNPPVRSEVDAPPEIAEILRRSCYDCHSHETRWPWYARVAPVSWWLADHVRHARGAMNFSRWPDPATASGRMAAAYSLEEACEEVQKGAMPLPSYRLMHTGARLTEEEIETLCRWAREEAARLTGG